MDRLRWQMFQIAVGSSSLIIAFAREGSHIEPWALRIVGALLLILGGVKIRIGDGIRRNSKVLHEAAASIGDSEIPMSSMFKSVSFWISCSLVAIGILILVCSEFITGLIGGK